MRQPGPALNTATLSQEPYLDMVAATSGAIAGIWVSCVEYLLLVEFLTPGAGVVVAIRSSWAASVYSRGPVVGR